MTMMGATDAAAPPREGLITGDAVLLDLRPAPFPVRMISAIIDGVLQLLLFFGAVIGLVWVASRLEIDQGYIAAALVLISVLVFVGYPLLSELLLRGRSVGRLVMGTRVVRDDGGPVHARQSLLRAVMAMFEIWSTSGALAVTCSLLDRRSRRVGDLLAGTMVIQERMRDLVPQRPEMPEQLHTWATGADVGRLPLTLLQDIRGFLPRAEQMNPASRHQLSRELLQRTLPHVAPAPPPGTDPETFLRAVLSERSRRDEARLQRARARQDELSAEVRAVPFAR